jgi:hypothetical protein
MAGVLAAMGVWIASVQESVGERRHRPPATPRLTVGVENEPSPGAFEASRAEVLQAPAVSRGSLAGLVRRDEEDRLPPSLRRSTQTGGVAIHDAVEGFQDRLLAGHPTVRERVPDLGEREEEVEEECPPRLDLRPSFWSTARTASGEKPKRANRSKTRPIRVRRFSPKASVSSTHFCSGATRRKLRKKRRFTGRGKVRGPDPLHHIVGLERRHAPTARQRIPLGPERIHVRVGHGSPRGGAHHEDRTQAAYSRRLTAEPEPQVRPPSRFTR